MKIELSTGLCGLFQPDTYGSEICYDVPSENMDEVKELAMELGEEYLNDAIAETMFRDSVIKVTNFWSPQWYNYQTDDLDFEIEFGDWVVRAIFDEYFDDQSFFEYIKVKFGSYPGFASFMPIDKKDFFKALALKDTDQKNFDRAIAMVLHYEIMMTLGKSIDDWYFEFIDDWRERISMDGLDCDEEDFEEEELENEFEKEITN